MVNQFPNPNKSSKKILIQNLKTMKKILLALLLATVWSASAQQVTNRYSMKLSKNPDGSYSLINEARYAN